jgi:uncharacterized ion transporter superfamily protein YfcC
MEGRQFMILDVLKLAVGAGTHIMKNRQKRKMLESDAAMVHAQKMANGEIEYQQVVRKSQDNGWKDEFVLILISLPILLLIWSVFSDDPLIKEKIDIFFEQFAALPMWYQMLFVGVVGSIYGLKGVDIFKNNQKK